MLSTASKSSASIAPGPIRGLSAKLDHKAGEKLFVDYADDKLTIVDPDSGAAQPVETLVAILGGQRTDLCGGQRHATT